MVSIPSTQIHGKSYGQFVRDLGSLAVICKLGHNCRGSCVAMQFLLGYLFVVNAITLVLAACDTWLALRRRRHVPEGLLLALSLGGGAIGALLAQLLTGHKQLKAEYCASLTLIVFLQAGAVAAILSERLREEVWGIYQQVALSLAPVEEEVPEEVTHVSQEPPMPRRFGPGS